MPAPKADRLCNCDAVSTGGRTEEEPTRRSDRTKTLASWNDLQDGAWLILKGLFKKAVMADNLAVFVDQVFSGGTNNGLEVLLGTYAFAFQIYGDFSGYTDIARGIGKFIGYDLMLNFRRPYLATDPSDFWQRWHISLSSWLRDYLYIRLEIEDQHLPPVAI